MFRTIEKRIDGLIDKKFFMMVLGAFPFLTAWHELGHILIGKLFGFRTYFFFTTSLAFYTKNSPCYPNCQFGEYLVHWGGPVFSWLLIWVSFFAFLRWRKKVFLLGLALIGPFYNNFLADLLTFLFLGDDYPLALGDENKIAEYLNIPAIVISGSFALVGTVILLISYLKIEKSERRKLVVSSILASLVSHIIIWIILEPLFEPDTITLWRLITTQ